MFTQQQLARILKCADRNRDLVTPLELWSDGEIDLEEAVVLCIEALVMSQDVMAKAFAFTAQQQGWKGGKGTYSQ